MSADNLNFTFQSDQIDQLSKKIGIQPGKFLIAIRMKNYNIIKNFINDDSFKDLIQSTDVFLNDYFKKRLDKQSQAQIILCEPYYFVTIDSTVFCKKLVYDLDNVLSLRIYPEYDVQFSITYAEIQENTTEYFLKNIINTLESDINLSGIVPYKENITQILIKEYNMLSNLKSSIKGRLARFAYQPIIDCITGNTAYYECLLRIPNDDGELISAGQSILVAEKYSMIHCIDSAVIEMACMELSAAKDLHLSVNISNIGLLDNRLAEKARSLLKNRSIASRLIIEITETSVNEDFATTSQFVNMMREFGCRIAIDDFGSGSSSFKQLKNIKFDILKIDGSLIRDIPNNPYSRFLVDMLVKIAEEVGAKTVAEFVEDGAIAKFLLDCKVNFMQGNFFSPAQNFRTWSKK